MSKRFRFSTSRLLLATAVLAVWAAVFVNRNQRLGSVNSVPSVPPHLDWVAALCFFVMPILLLAWLAAVIVKSLGKKSILLAFCGAVTYVAFIVWLSWVMGV